MALLCKVIIHHSIIMRPLILMDSDGALRWVPWCSPFTVMIEEFTTSMRCARLAFLKGKTKYPVTSIRPFLALAVVPHFVVLLLIVTLLSLVIYRFLLARNRGKIVKLQIRKKHTGEILRMMGDPVDKGSKAWMAKSSVFEELEIRDRGRFAMIRHELRAYLEDLKRDTRLWSIWRASSRLLDGQASVHPLRIRILFFIQDSATVLLVVTVYLHALVVAELVPVFTLWPDPEDEWVYLFGSDINNSDHIFWVLLVSFGAVVAIFVLGFPLLCVRIVRRTIKGEHHRRPQEGGFSEDRYAGTKASCKFLCYGFQDHNPVKALWEIAHMVQRALICTLTERYWIQRLEVADALVLVAIFASMIQTWQSPYSTTCNKKILRITGCSGVCSIFGALSYRFQVEFQTRATLRPPPKMKAPAYVPGHEADFRFALSEAIMLCLSFVFWCMIAVSFYNEFAQYCHSKVNFTLGKERYCGLRVLIETIAECIARPVMKIFASAANRSRREMLTITIGKLNDGRSDRGICRAIRQMHLHDHLEGARSSRNGRISRYMSPKDKSQEVILKVGDGVSVKSGTENAFEQIPAQAHGQVLEIKEDGYAKIDFGDEGQHWVCRSDWRKLEKACTIYREESYYTKPTHPMRDRFMLAEVVSGALRAVFAKLNFVSTKSSPKIPYTIMEFFFADALHTQEARSRGADPGRGSESGRGEVFKFIWNHPSGQAEGLEDVFHSGPGAPQLFITMRGQSMCNVAKKMVNQDGDDICRSGDRWAKLSVWNLENYLRDLRKVDPNVLRYSITDFMMTLEEGAGGGGDEQHAERRLEHLRNRGVQISSSREVACQKNWKEARVANTERSQEVAAKPVAEFEETMEQEKEKTSDLREMMGKLKPGSLLVTIISASNLPDHDLDLEGCSDPYASCEVVGRPHERVTTKICADSLNPVWNFSFCLANWHPGDPLLFQIHDADFDTRRGDDVLGSAVLKSRSFEHEGFEGELTLQVHSGHIPEDQEQDPKIYVRVETSSKGSEESKPPVKASEDSAPMLLEPQRESHTKFPMLTPRSSALPKMEQQPFNEDDLWDQKQKELIKAGDYVVVREELRTGDNTLIRPCECGVVKSAVWGAAEVCFEAEGARWVPKKEMPKLAKRAERPRLARDAKKAVSITVTIVRAHDLRNADHSLHTSDVSDPYCICEVPGKPIMRIRTGVIKDSLNPVWMHTEMMSHYEPGDPLKFTVMDKDLRKQDDFLGSATLKGSDFFPNGFRGPQLVLEDRRTKGSKKVAVPPTLEVVIQVDRPRDELEENEGEGYDDYLAQIAAKGDSFLNSFKRSATTTSVATAPVINVATAFAEASHGLFTYMGSALSRGRGRSHRRGKRRTSYDDADRAMDPPEDRSEEPVPRVV
jgi:hypothetical protein